MFKDILINKLHELYKTDSYINQLYNSVGIEMDNIDNIIEDLSKEYFFDTMTEDIGIPLFEKLLNFKTDSNSSLDNRRSQLEARYKSFGKCDLDLIQGIIGSWKNGNAQIQLIDGDINIKLISSTGFPKDLDNIYKAINIVKPAQIPADYELLSITNMDAFFGAATISGETITVYPWNNKEIETTGIINIGSAPAINAETTTIYPREVN